MRLYTAAQVRVQSRYAPCHIHAHLLCGIMNLLDCVVRGCRSPSDACTNQRPQGINGSRRCVSPSTHSAAVLDTQFQFIPRSVSPTTGTRSLPVVTVPARLLHSPPRKEFHTSFAIILGVVFIIFWVWFCFAAGNKEKWSRNAATRTFVQSIC